MLHTSYRNLIEPISARAVRDPDWPGLVLIREGGGHDTVTARELDAEIRAFAEGLRTAGLEADDIVILVMGHSRELIAAFLGAMHLGAVPCIFSNYLTEKLDLEPYQRRVAALVSDADARAVITIPETKHATQAAVGDRECLVLSHEEIRSPSGAARTVAAPVHRPEKTAFLQYTSGSGGVLKGITHSHGAVLRYIEAKRRLRLKADDVIVSWLPLYHDMGLVSGLLTACVLGLRTVLMSPQHWIRNPAILFRAMQEFQGTVCFMPNFALNHCVRSVRDRDLEGIDLCRWDSLVVGGEPVRLETLQMFVGRFAPYGFRESSLHVGYGMAENVEGATATPRGQVLNVDWIDLSSLLAERRAVVRAPQAPGAIAIMSCGVPFQGTAVRIAGGGGDALPERSVGSVLIRSEYMLTGYYCRPDLTQQVIQDGWFHTGDLGYLANGELYVTGRQTDLIIVGGRNVYPENLERIADNTAGLYPGRSVAFGVPDERSGSERIVMVCETNGECSDAQKAEIERRLRRAIVHEFDVALGSVRLVEKGWVIKTSSGKKARGENREKHRRQFGDG